MTVANIMRSQFGELKIDFIHRDRATLNVDQTMRIALEISDDAIFGVDGDAITVAVWKGRGDDSAQRDIFQFSNSSENVADLARFDFELMRVVDMLVSAAAAASEISTRRLDSMRRVLAKIDNVRLRELFLLADDFRRDQLAVDCERNKNRLAVFARDAFAAKGDIFDLKIDDAHTEL
jgi:hypothetical protein